MKNGQKHGKGVLQYNNNDSYKGEFKHGKKHGYGVEDTKTVHYEGYFENDLYNGHGKYTNKEINTIFEGAFKDGLVINNNQ